MAGEIYREWNGTVLTIEEYEKIMKEKEVEIK